MKKLEVKIKEILKEPMKLDFIPQVKSNLKYMHQWTLGELRKSAYGDEAAMDTLSRIIKESGFGV